MENRLRLLQILLILVVAAMLLLGMWTGLERLGWVSLNLRTDVAPSHGALMIGGVLGTLICLERAVGVRASLNTSKAYVVPFITGAGGLLLAIGQDGLLARLLITFGSLGLLIIFVFIGVVE